MTKYVVYIDKNSTEKEVKDVKRQFKKFLNKEDRVIYFNSEETFIATLDETISTSGGTITGPLTIKKQPVVMES